MFKKNLERIKFCVSLKNIKVIEYTYIKEHTCSYGKNIGFLHSMFGL